MTDGERVAAAIDRLTAQLQRVDVSLTVLVVLGVIGLIRACS